ncbi:MAG: type II secretion system protein [Planctomycetota bacterium]|nr:type II secretion system protein [Planctomycetota bacterium]MCZ6611736.1 type II secretion system protein [Planctomycetota bacterium]
MQARAEHRAACGMTMVEILVVIAVLAVLMGLLLPTLSRVREHSGETTCASNLRQLEAATLAYRAAWKDHLPQVAALSPFSGEDEIIGALFGGKRGELDFFGINEIGADERPLNTYLSPDAWRSDDDGDEYIDEHVPAFLCPLDRGQPAQPSAFLEEVSTMYDYIGTSYTLNDHALDSEDCWTLIPDRTPSCDATGRPGGKMPSVEDPTKTWMLGDLPIYNYQEFGDRRQRWHFDKVQVNLAFVDGHVGVGIEVPKSTALSDTSGSGTIVQNTTKFYTFLPSRDWLEPLRLSPPWCHCGP